MQRLGRSSGLIDQLEIGMKRGEVQRHIVAQVLEDPVRELPEFFLLVVESGDDEVGDLEPDASLVPQPAQGLEHRLQVGERDLGVELFGECFQVDVGGIDVLVDIEERLARDVAVRDHHVIEPGAVRLAGNVDDVLTPDRRLVISEGEMRDAALDCELHHLGRR